MAAWGMRADRSHWGGRRELHHLAGKMKGVLVDAGLEGAVDGSTGADRIRVGQRTPTQIARKPRGAVNLSKKRGTAPRRWPPPGEGMASGATKQRKKNQLSTKSRGPTAHSMYTQWTTTLRGTVINTATSDGVNAGHDPQWTHSQPATVSSASCL